MDLLLPPPGTGDDESGSVAVVGAGSIGAAWIVVFASAGRHVRVYESNPSTRDATRATVHGKLVELKTAGLLDDEPEAVLARVLVCETLAEALHDVVYVQESVIEDLEVKVALFREMDRLTEPHAVLASSTSTIVASAFAADLPGRARCLVVHPGNPPYFLRVAEIVPADFTSAEAIAVAHDLLAEVDIAPIVLDHEVEGFVFNRLQGALLREAYCLVRDGVISVADLDVLVRDGLGRRWSVIGPFTTSELNTRGGLRRHGEVIGPVYARLGLERGQENPWTAETIERVATEVQAQLPHPDWEENVRERDRAMTNLAVLLKSFENPLVRRREPAHPRASVVDKP
ncbi:3-hydroxyacyl-CoA dehydrogenase [Plantibacter sp. ME-Dv--P-122b]|uniref:3-hydroxyacyl-CoA dehydrogenase n=1 Tax=Plantibacter sp. ME-Dv--P-122b TaxID=3040300 RepID=UPI00255139FC|nr:3-hydroxyacyl-CoA dehydrogenase [Plantibacter sp. ME-Dv--P-122b]